MNATPARTESEEAIESTVTNKARIGHLLMRLMETRAPLTLMVPGQPQPSTTLLLHLDFKSGEMVLDEPYPARSLTPATPPRLRGRVEGSTVEFEAPLLRVASVRGISAPVVALPERLNHSERRGNFRVHIPADLYLPPTTFTSRDGAFRGRLLDVSEHGAGSLVVSEGMADVGRVLACTLSLPGTRLMTDVEVCSLATDSGSRRLGFRFSGLNPAQKTAMTRAVASLDRHLLRRYASAVWV